MNLEEYKEALDITKAHKDYHLRQIRIHKEALKECNSGIKRCEAKIKELNKNEPRKTC